MVIVTAKRYNNDKKMMYCAAAASGAVGMGGITLGAIALIKTHKVRTEVNQIHTDMERRMSAEEGMSRQFTKAISQVQNVMEDNGLLRVRH